MCAITRSRFVILYLHNRSELEEKYVIRDWPLFINSAIILGGVVR